MVKKILFSILGAVIQGVIAWIASIAVTHIQNWVYNKLIKKPFCVICGGTGYKFGNVECHCETTKEFRWGLKKLGKSLSFKK